MTLSLTSAAFTAGGAIPKRYTCEGDDVSPPFTWRDPPAGTKSLVLIVDDPDAPDPAAPKLTWVHWVLYDIPSTAGGLPEAVKPSALREPVRDSTTGSAPATAVPARRSVGIAISTSSTRSTPCWATSGNRPRRSSRPR